MNDLQKETIKNLKEDLHKSQYTAIKLFINGKYQVYDGSFLSELLCGQIEPPVKPDFGVSDIEKYFIGKTVTTECDISPYDKDIKTFVVKYVDVRGEHTGDKGIWIRGEESVWFNINTASIIKIE